MENLNRPIKILTSTDSPALTSGLASTARNIFLPLIKRYPGKYEMHSLGFFHFNPTEPIPWPIYQTKINRTPNGPQMDLEDKYGEKSFDEIAARIKPDIVFGYGDYWHFAPTINSVYRNNYRLCLYYTIDGSPYYGHLEADGSTHWGAGLSKADQIVSLSHFGKDVLYKSCPELKDREIKVAYHPIDVNKYPLLTQEQKQENRERVTNKIIGARNNFICGFVGRNQFRKQNYKLWELAHYMVHGDYIECKECNRITSKEWDFASRKSKEKDDLTLYDVGYDYSYCWHCRSENIVKGEPNPNFYLWCHSPKNDPGYNMDLHQRMWDISPYCIYTPVEGQRLSREHLTRIMCCFDAMYYPSGGEGFANPISEILSLGIPIVYSNYSAHAENAKHGGLPVRVTYIPELFHGIQRATVDNNHAIEQMLKLVRDKEFRIKLGLEGRDYISQFSLDTMAEVWDGIFSSMMLKSPPIENKLLHAGVV